MLTVLRRFGPLVLALIGCAVLVVAEFSDLYSIRTRGVGDQLTARNAGPQHGYALLIIAIAAALLAFGALRGGSRPAAGGVVALSLVALLIGLAVDLPDLDETGKFGQAYDAVARGEVGFRLEITGAVLLLLAGVLMLVVGTGAEPTRARGRKPRGTPAEG